MATIVLSAAGAAAGSALGGSVLGLSSAVLGRAVGATLGRVIDQQLLGSGSQAVETGKVERFRLTGASEGAAVGRLWGRSRVAGQVIWASRFRETVSSHGGGKGAPSRPKVKQFSYSVSLGIALCEGRIARVGRIWADGTEIEPQSLTMWIHDGAEDQLPDALIEAIEGEGRAPAYRGTAYVVIADMDLARFGNRVPQLTFEVVRRAAGAVDDLPGLVQGMALIPGTGEYALATTPVHFSYGPGQAASANVNTPSGKTDIATSLDMLQGELPNVRSVSLVVSWFASDLRAPVARIRPKVEQTKFDGQPMPWQVAGLSRSMAEVVPHVDGKPIYGGTPTDASVVEAIRALRQRGQEAVFYPFILMDQLEGNSLIYPYTGVAGQPPLPWRGRITLNFAPNHAFTTDGSRFAEEEVALFFGTARPEDFELSGQDILYSGPDDWSYRRFILHYAHLCVLAGGVSAFCIGSELRGLTTIRGAEGRFPAVEALRALAADVRRIVGPSCKIGYAADWSEYFGFHPEDGTGDVLFHLDPLWADPAIDFVGIDNYMPLSDWRDGDEHADASWRTIHDRDYLRSNIEGGEGFDWYYGSQAARDAQIRTPITDGAHGEPWVWRYKDLRSWWQNAHHDRIDGVRSAEPTAWVPQSKPIWFTELGCPAVDKGTNAPNLFSDPKSSENALPPYSTGARDDLIQHQYLRAMLGYWGDPAINPVSELYGAPMVDMSRAHVWAWDARPYPQFPANRALWSDGDNYSRGHWLNGRASAQALDAVIREICTEAGVSDLDVSDVYGLVRGYAVGDLAGARAALQPLMLAYGIEAAERDGRIVFFNRDGRERVAIDAADLARTGELAGDIEHSRTPEAETAGRVRLSFVEADGAYETRAAEAIFPDEASRTVSASEMPLVLTGAEGQAIVERWLAESRVARDRVRLALPLSSLSVGAGDVMHLSSGDYRIDRVDLGDTRRIEAVRVERGLYLPPRIDDRGVLQPAFAAPLPVHALFMDLPLLTGDEVPHAPYLAAAAVPWPGSVDLYAAVEDAGYTLNTTLERSAVIGITETPLHAAAPGRWDRGPALRVKLASGTLSSVREADLLAGANLAAIGTGDAAGWELFQFAEAELVEAGTYDLRMRLRGQAGTEADMPELWPVGSTVVLIDARLSQIALPASARGLERHYRFGPGTRAFDDPSYSHARLAFDGIGLRPYAPCHLRSRKGPGADLTLSWIRRTRIDGDSWASVEVPLGEAREVYALRVMNAAGDELRAETVTAPGWTYTAAMQVADGAVAPFVVEVAQLSDQFGPGPYRRIEIDG
ncbi:baseplate multidomain protein megatron [Rhodovulum sulfidophilum]|uniref:Glycoside hydrolase/phage tail family protein n=1 Tax=Rhodovulum sulfidophilum TaxID=35806 RepID=A0ABS1RNP4_RHOSU|nr:glycoside hydrolase/phage tail family protein [Rhodovulum sulfidophilum]MBL3607690.1 glycoside hydrolase/phage tail family protein [Rhodovulum sulfidophilum]MCE8456681.1 glycoside hydrolase/phage tail family protein [Rhodovulum sulfidophilum]